MVGTGVGSRARERKVLSVPRRTLKAVAESKIDGTNPIEVSFEIQEDDLDEIDEEMGEGVVELLGFTPTDEGVAVTVQPKGLEEPVTVELRVVSATVLSPEAAKRARRRFGWPESEAEPPNSEH